MDLASEVGLNDSCEDLLLTQNSFIPPENYCTQEVVEDIDYLMTFEHKKYEVEEDWHEHKSVQYFDFSYQLDNSSNVTDMQGSLSQTYVNEVGGDYKDESIIPLICDLHLDEISAEVRANIMFYL